MDSLGNMRDSALSSRVLSKGRMARDNSEFASYAFCV
jgi:hypothetical protein